MSELLIDRDHDREIIESTEPFTALLDYLIGGTRYRVQPKRCAQMVLRAERSRGNRNVVEIAKENLNQLLR